MSRCGCIRVDAEAIGCRPMVGADRPRSAFVQPWCIRHGRPALTSIPESPISATTHTPLNVWLHNMNYPLHYVLDVRVIPAPGSPEGHPRYAVEFLVSVDESRIRRVLAKTNYRDSEAIYAGSVIASETASTMVSLIARTTPDEIQRSEQPILAYPTAEAIAAYPICSNNDGVVIRKIKETPG